MMDSLSTDLAATLDEAGRALLFTDARTANTFASTLVSDQELAEIWDLAKWAPTMANTQPLRVLYVRNARGQGPPGPAHGRRQQGQGPGRAGGRRAGLR